MVPFQKAGKQAKRFIQSYLPWKCIRFLIVLYTANGEQKIEISRYPEQEVYLYKTTYMSTNAGYGSKMQHNSTITKMANTSILTVYQKSALFVNRFKNVPGHRMSYKTALAPSEETDQSTYPRCPIRAGHKAGCQWPSVFVHSDDFDQTARMRRLISVFAEHIWNLA